MVIGLGLDLVEIERVRGSLERWGDRFVRKLMDPPEAALLPEAPSERARALAFSIAGKEAASKALGTGWARGVRWRDVVVGPGPGFSVRLLGRAAEVARSLGSSGATRVRIQASGDIVVGEVRLVS